MLKKKYAKFRFSKQVRINDCAPAAIINLMKFNGVKIPYKTSYQKLYNHFKIAEYGGTPLKTLAGYLVNKKIPKSVFVDFAENLSVKSLRLHLDIFPAAVLLFGRGPHRSGHVCLVTGHNKNGFEVVNWSKKSSVQTVPYLQFKQEVVNNKEAFYYFYERK